MRFFKDFGLSQMSSPELGLIGLNELVSLDRWALERRSRALAQTVFLGNQVTLCRVLGRYKLYIPTTDEGFGAHVMMDGIWEPWLTVFMARRIKPGMAVVDAGANHGYYTVLFADLVGSAGRVAAIEPNPVTAEFLRRSVRVNGYEDRVEVFEKALASADNLILVFLAPGSEPKNARVVSDIEAGHSDTITVSSARLDTLLAGWPRLDFIKIDVEGAEEAMLSGGWGIISRDRPEMLLEFNSGRCSDPEGLLDQLEQLYGHPTQYVQYDCTTSLVDRQTLLDPSNREDWLLSFLKT